MTHNRLRRGESAEHKPPERKNTRLHKPTPREDLAAETLVFPLRVQQPRGTHLFLSEGGAETQIGVVAVEEGHDEGPADPAAVGAEGEGEGEVAGEREGGEGLHEAGDGEEEGEVEGEEVGFEEAEEDGEDVEDVGGAEGRGGRDRGGFVEERFGEAEAGVEGCGARGADCGEGGE